MLSSPLHWANDKSRIESLDFRKETAAICHRIGYRWRDGRTCADLNLDECIRPSVHNLDEMRKSGSCMPLHDRRTIARPTTTEPRLSV
jgi:hypothetical protein